jgi:glycosyltransferase involved in cell wall biosynthesis
MAYEPNQKAVDWLINHAWPVIIDQLPTAKLYIIGRDPSKALLDRVVNERSIKVTGTVDNIWQYYNSLDVFLCPLQNGAGLQNKILEAMYAKLPIVASNIANSGLNATKKEIILADDPQLFSDEALNLIVNTKRASELGNAAYEFVNSKFSWPNIVKQLLDDF